MTEPQDSAEWDARYSEQDQLWSGEPNKALVDLASELRKGRSLDIGCGEGADVVFLARNGWDATGIDLSTVAIDRAKRAADVRNVQAEFHVANVEEFARSHNEAYDLVTVFFFHSRDEELRAAAMRTIPELVKPGGHLLVVSHGQMPPWSKHHEHEDGSPRPTFDITPESEREELRVDSDWHSVIAETRYREVTGPEGEEVTLSDAVLLVRKPAG